MAISNLLAGVQVSLIGSLGSVSYKYAWLLGVIESFIGIVADVGLGIILFTLVLKLITLPLDQNGNDEGRSRKTSETIR